MSIGKFRNTTLEQATNKKNRNKIVRRSRRPPKDISIWITTTMVIITSTVQVRKMKKMKKRRAKQK